MATSVGQRSPPRPRADDGPHLVAPRPIYAEPSPLTHFESNRSGQSGSGGAQGGQQDGLGAEQSSIHGPPSSLRAMTDSQTILPVRGGELEAQGAREKLERMERSRQGKRRWGKGTRTAGTSATAKSGVKKADQHGDQDGGDDGE